MFIFPIFSTLKVSNFTTETFILSTCKILIIHWTISFWPQKNRYKMIGYRNSTEAWKFFEPQKFLFFENFRIFVKFYENFENFKQRWNEKIFLPRLGNVPVLVEKIFSLLYRRWSTSKFCRWLIYSIVRQIWLFQNTAPKWTSSIVIFVFLNPPPSVFWLWM